MVNLLVVCFLLFLRHAEGGHFLGAALSYTFKDNNTAEIEVITSWVLGHGLCGPGCSEATIGPLVIPPGTNLSGYGQFYLTMHHTNRVLLNYERSNSMDVHIIAVSTNAQWEQDWMKFTIDLNNSQSLYLEYTGKSWTDFAYQGQALPWSIANAVNIAVRNDTLKPNSSPKVLLRPYYNAKWNDSTFIHLPSVDKDGDIVKCFKAQFVDAGVLRLPPGVKVNENCTIQIDAFEFHGYRNDTWMGLDVVLRDYNTDVLLLEADLYQPITLPITSSNVQFAVHIIDTDDSPVFIEPTPVSVQKYVVYNGSQWDIHVCAKGSGNNDISDFVVTSIDTAVKQSTLQSGKDGNSMKCVDLSWKPTTADIGPHIICISAVDTSGMISDEERCYTVEVNGENFNNSNNISQTKPYFVDFPGYRDPLQCSVYTVCALPLFVKSQRNVTSISTVEHYTNMAQTTEVKNVARNGELLYQTDLSFVDKSPGMKEVCVIATDENGVSSDKTCFYAEIIPEDPCYSSPCQNSARCKMVDTSGAFLCQCLPSFSGKLCEHRTGLCEPSPCVHGQCYDLRNKLFCYCEPGFTGTYCETPINECLVTSCNVHGACQDRVKGYECDCMERYAGDECETDLCPSRPEGQPSCSIHVLCRIRNEFVFDPPECNPNPCIHGMCSAGPKCTCRTGYRGAFCDTAIGVPHNSTGVEFIAPTPPNGSQLVCYKHNDSLVPCQLMVYVSSAKSFNINIDTPPGLVATWKLGVSNEVSSYRKVFNVLVTLHSDIASVSQPYVCLNVHQLGSETDLCYSISIQPDPMETETTLQYLRQNASSKFLPPTWNDGSKLRCTLGETCRIVVYTKSNQGVCDNVVPTSQASSVTIFPPYHYNDTGVCSTEVDIKLQNGTDRVLCFLSGFKDYQQVCFMTEELSPLENPCTNNPCQHGGLCFYDKAYTYHCVCKPGYVGDHCETGPCMQSTDDCKNGGYCLSHNTTNTCICQIGYPGSKCEPSAGLPAQSSVPAFFYGAAVPTMIECVVNQPYTFSQIIELTKPLAYKPIVENGYVSVGLSVKANVIPHNDSYEAKIMLLAERPGLHDACIQINNQQGITDEELCFKVWAITDPFTLYARKDRPHFVGSSLPTGTNVECIAGESCHILYQVTAGQGNENDCIDVKLNRVDGFPKYHVFSTCGSCSARGKVNSICTVDISIDTDTTDVGAIHSFSVLARLKTSGLEGEERTFTLTIASDKILSSTARNSCQTLQCLNGGFCDGHIPDSPRCFCKQGYSGVSCEKAQIQTSFSVNQKQTFVGDMAVPSEVECTTGTLSTIPFQIIRNPRNGDSTRLQLGLGYVDDSIGVNGPFVDTIDNMEYIGYVNINCTAYGKHNVCLQTGNQGSTEDELCVVVNVVATHTRSVTGVDKYYPYFLYPTLPDESLVLCEVNRSCHLDVYYTTGDQFGIGGTCPQLTQTNTRVLDRLHIFEPKLNSHYCSVDVVYVPPEANVTRKLCLQVTLPGKPGEIRCFRVKVIENVNEEVSSPCRGQVCGDVTRFKCIANLTLTPPTPECICQTGYSGPNCEAAPTCSITCINGGFCQQDVCFCIDGFGGEHCEIVFNPCASNPCVRGLCFHHQTSFHCICPPGYDGQTCDIDVNECFSRPCINGGACIDGINGYACHCSSGFTGNQCQTNVDECISNPCLHGATCHDEINQYSCRCTPEYKGDRCETEVNPCESSPCVKGRCFHHLLDYHCVCDDGYAGAHCETDIDECASMPCMNDATCIDEINQFSCNCSAGYAGVLCETDINECASRPCLNGGFCHDELDQFTCHCPSGYEGTVCEKVVDPCIPSPCNNGQCFSSGQQIFCDCPPRYAGTFCQTYLGLQLLGPKESTMHIATGSELVLNCSVSSNYPVTFGWNKVNLCEDLTNDTEGSVLIVSRNATIGNMGTYVCTAADKQDPTITKYFNVNVKVNDFSETCNFDNSLLCSWRLHVNGGIDWALRNGTNSSIDGAMLYDHTQGSEFGRYLYIETTSSRNFGDRAVLASSNLPAKHTLCFEFWYYIYGDDVEITVTLEDSCLKTETQVFFKSGNQGNSWHKSSNTIQNNSVPNDYRILIKADIGSTNEGDVAIDDLTLSDGQCKNELNPPFVG